MSCEVSHLYVHGYIRNYACKSSWYSMGGIRVESGPDDPVTWVTFLVGQVGLIHKLNYLDVTWISHVLWKTVLASGK